MKMNVLPIVILTLASVSCTGQSQKSTTPAPAAKSQPAATKTLVAYFSATGTTAKAAATLAEVTGGDLFEIVPEQRYTDADLDWHDSKSRSSVEMQDKSSRPAVKSKVEHMEQYEVVYVGFPIWWYIAPTIVNTFLEQYNLEGKTVIPFFTSGGSGKGKTLDYLRPSAPKANWKEPINLTGADKAKVEKLVKGL